MAKIKLFGIEKQVPYPKVDYKNLDRDKLFADEAKHQEDVKAYLKQLGFTGKHTGELIKMSVADGQALYMIAEGPKTFGLVHLAYGDGYHYTGIENFPKAQILKLAEQEKAYKKLFERSDSFWTNRKVGEIVHYDNGFEAFVRGVIVETPKGNAMKPIALVGNWKAHDLPKWGQTGELELGYHAKKIQTGETMTPNDSTMYEANPARFKMDPRPMKAIDLTPPALKPEEIVAKQVTALRFKASKMLSDIDWKGDGVSFTAAEKEALRSVRELLNSADVEAVIAA